MLNVRQVSDDVVELTLAGVVDRSDIEIMERDLTPFLTAEGRKAIVLRIEELDDMTGDALAEDARYELSLMKEWPKVAKLAVVTRKQAFDAMVKWIAPVLPMIEFRTFTPEDADEAQEWASDIPDTVEPGGGVNVVEDGADGLMVFEVAGRITQEDAEGLFARFDGALEGRDKINLMVVIKDYEGFDLTLLGDRDVMSSKFGAMGKVGRYAIVGAPGWMRTAVQGMAPFLPLEMRSFDADEERAARAWASAG